jgi:hypothetical protein
VKNIIFDWIQWLMHSLPGMPPHSDAAHPNRNVQARRLASHVHKHAAKPSQSVRSVAARQQPEPRVLVAWQKWIGRNLAEQKEQA